MRREFALPDVGEGLTEAEIVTWNVAPGDQVQVNQILCEIETAKAAVELPSPWAGTVGELLVQPGQTVAVGSPIIVIETAEAEPAAAPAPPPAPAAAEERGPKIGEAGQDGRIATLVGYGPRPGSVTRRPRKRPAAPPPPAPEPRPAPAAAPATDGRATVPLAKPPVRKLAKDLGVDLRTVTPSGPDGVITRADVEAAAGAGSAAPAVSSGGERRVPIRGVRRATAAAVTQSAFTAPHVTEFLSVDVTATMQLRDRLRADRAYRDVKLTPLAFVAKAVCLAVERTPELNARWDEDAGEIVYHDHVQLGIAAATPRGLIVPKIRDADTLSLRELAIVLAELTETARAGKTPPSDLVGGTFTITNVGVFGVDTGTPILNPGEAGILAVGAIKPMPWVVDGELAVRTVCQLALSFDHRLVDGEQGSRFLADVGALLSDPGLALTW
ncbi:pyruvate dehydrogenase E2 component (dihydrolipoamide acetyltransferase) [Pseudonocardia thermophila]|uniref:Dihydrolipoamide acetyltransferase component of pyruvate dehydrogenase complex n=1 Tax=Pseudonocardia thermophila TaxID=1848 RepID=A0A1M7AQD1_PSETH|nr:dihydrolipoamide acetyltransferase family protein [Pseudonocardia thermophila]SHL44962.1 pyruvate dehydrogenase E2 component (dihydrolipoamide acetyltransferase) [Pseudonocardia thermophila]